MYRKILTFFIIISVLLVSCKSSDEEYRKRDQDIDHELESLDDNYRQLIKNIYEADTDDILVYETYFEDGSLLEKTMNKIWKDREISYRKNMYDSLNAVETIYLFEKDKGYYIDLSSNEFSKKDVLHNDRREEYNNTKYKDLSILYEILQNKSISSIEKEADNTKIIFDDDTYRIYDKDYILIEKTENSEGIYTKTVLVDKLEDPDKIFDDYMADTDNMTEVSEVEDMKK